MDAAKVVSAEVRIVQMSRYTILEVLSQFTSSYNFVNSIFLVATKDT